MGASLQTEALEVFFQTVAGKMLANLGEPTLFHPLAASTKMNVIPIQPTAPVS